jgi:hypothetical protein
VATRVNKRGGAASVEAWPTPVRWAAWFVMGLVGARTWLVSLPVGIAAVGAWASTLLDALGLHFPSLSIPPAVAIFAKSVTFLLALGISLYAAGRVGWNEHQLQTATGRPRIELLDPEMLTYIDAARRSRKWWRIPVVNRGAPANVTARLTSTGTLQVKAPGGVLHQMGDNPADGTSFQTTCLLSRDETQRYDLVSVMESWRPKWAEVQVVSTATQSQVLVSGIVPEPLQNTRLEHAGTERYFVYYVHQIETEGYSELVELDGHYTFTITVYAGDLNWKQSYQVEAEPKTGALTVTKA